jgi:AbrB family looped-hinge helix DNA binding protein
MKTTLTRHGQTVVPAEIRKHHNLQEGDKLIWIDDGQVVKVILTDSDIVKALKGSGKGYKLTERLLAERRAEYKRNGNTTLQMR